MLRTPCCLFLLIPSCYAHLLKQLVFVVVFVGLPACRRVRLAGESAMSQRPYAGNMAPQVMLRDFLLHVVSLSDCRLAGKEPASAPTEMHVEARGVVMNAIDGVALLNSMYCDRETASDGNCGPDSLLRNFETLGPVTPAIRQTLQILQQRRRPAALQHARAQLAKWVETHAAMSLMPDVTLADLVLMDKRYTSIADYARVMSRPRAWVDSPMLVAASGFFEIQLVVFVGKGEPQLLISPTVSGRDELPVVVIACVANVHYMALLPMNTEDLCETSAPPRGDPLLDEIAQARPGSLTPNHEVLQDASPVEEHEAYRGGLQSNAGMPAAMDEATVNFFRHCEAVASFDPWSIPSLNPSHTCDGKDVQSNSSFVLKCRSAIKILQMENDDVASGLLGKEFMTAIAKNT